MSMYKIKTLISILMDSSLYLTLSLKERHSLLARMAENYPFLVEAESDKTDVGYGSTSAGIILTT